MKWWQKLFNRATKLKCLQSYIPKIEHFRGRGEGGWCNLKNLKLFLRCSFFALFAYALEKLLCDLNDGKNLWRICSNHVFSENSSREKVSLLLPSFPHIEMHNSIFRKSAICELNRLRIRAQFVSPMFIQVFVEPIYINNRKWRKAVSCKYQNIKCISISTHRTTYVFYVLY